MSDISEEYRLLNNVAVMLDLGWDIITAVTAMRDDVVEKELREHYDEMLNRLHKGDDLGDVLAESKLVNAATSRLIIRTGQSTGMLQERLIRTANLVSFNYQGGWDPRRRFLETFAVLVEMGVHIEQALEALNEDFAGQMLGEVCQQFLQARKNSEPLYTVAQKFPEFFSHQCCQLLRYGERRNLARALHSIIKLV